MKRKVVYEQFEKLFSNTWIAALVSAKLDVFLLFFVDNQAENVNGKTSSLRSFANKTGGNRQLSVKEWPRDSCHGGSVVTCNSLFTA